MAEDEKKDTVETTPETTESPQESIEPVVIAEPEGQTELVPTPEATGEPESAAPTVSDQLVSAAVEMGVPETFARTFDDDKALRDHLVLKSAVSGRPAAASTEPDTKPEPEETLKPVAFSPFELKLPEGLSEYDETLAPFIEQVGEMNKHYRAQFDAMQATINKLVPMGADVTAMRKTAQADSHTRAVATFDKWIASLPTEQSEMLGTGATEQLKTSNPALWERRRKVYDDASHLIRALASTPGQQAPAPEVAFAYGLMKNFGPGTVGVTAPATNGRGRQTIARPTNRRATATTTAADDEKQEVEGWANHLRERGVAVETGLV